MRFFFYKKMETFCNSLVEFRLKWTAAFDTIFQNLKKENGWIEIHSLYELKYQILDYLDCRSRTFHWGQRSFNHRRRRQNSSVWNDGNVQEQFTFKIHFLSTFPPSDVRTFMRYFSIFSFKLSVYAHSFFLKYMNQKRTWKQATELLKGSH